MTDKAAFSRQMPHPNPRSSFSPPVGFLTGLLWALLCLQPVTLASALMELRMLQSATFSDAEAEANDTRQAVIAITYIVVYLITAVVFARWIIKAHRLVRRLGAADLSITPGWAVGYFFIPFINLVRPYRAMKELWQASLDPRGWPWEPVSPLLPWWWAMWLIASFLGQISMRLSLRATTLEQFKLAAMIEIVTVPIDIILCLLALRLVRQISRRIRRHEAALEHPPVPPPPVLPV